MKSLFIFFLFVSQILQAQDQINDTHKKAVIASVEKHQQELISLSKQVWEFAETAMMERKSSKLLADYAESQGFRVTRGVAKIPTAFIAEYGSGSPIIGILGEYDALPGLSQKAKAVKETLLEGAPGHGCGHNLLGTGSMGAAVAIKELMAAGRLKGTIRYYGTPAEEDLAGKVWMAKAGVFNDLDICLDWHPNDENKAQMQSSQAVRDYSVIFKGKTAHAAGDPWNGRSALDAAELFTTGINMLREHVKPSVRMHYVYKKAGNVPNVVPEVAEVWIWIRDAKQSGVAVVSERMEEIARGAALMAGVECEVRLNSGLYDQLINAPGAKLIHDNMNLIGLVSYTEEELDFAEKIMKESGKEYKGIKAEIKPLEVTKEYPDGGSTDVGDVSYIVPVISLRAVTTPFEAIWHSWVVVACSGMSIGQKGMLFAAKVMGATMVDLFENEKLREEIKTEFLNRRGKEVWKPMVPGDIPPVR